jgi:hypothetical protein
MIIPLIGMVPSFVARERFSGCTPALGADAAPTSKNFGPSGRPPAGLRYTSFRFARNKIGGASVVRDG